MEKLNIRLKVNVNAQNVVEQDSIGEWLKEEELRLSVVLVMVKVL